VTHTTHAQDIKKGERFGFGENWTNFLGTLNEERIAVAELALGRMLETTSLMGMRFLDAGSGSGLSSLAARQMGATVHSFDYDPESVACTMELKRRYSPDDLQWTVEEGSVLDRAYLKTTGDFDVVYFWGVLHHTGQMWTAVANVSERCKSDGLLFIAIYNNMGGSSRLWTWIKRTYCKLPSALRIPFALVVTAPIQIWSLAVHVLQGKGRLYFDYIRNYRERRGMSWWHDQLDWIGGYPYEDAKPDEVFRFLRERGFSLVNMTTHGGHIGCNEFVFRKVSLG